MSTLIEIQGQEYENAQAPTSGRTFRDAWIVPVDDVIQLDVNKVAELCNDKRREWRAWADAQPFPYNSDTFDKDRASVDRIMGLMFMSNGAQAQGSTIEASLAAMGAPTTFTSATSTEHTIDDAFVAGLFTAMGAHTATIHGQSAAYKANIEALRAADDVAGLQAVYENFDSLMNT